MSYFLQDWYKKMDSDNVMLAYKGAITSDLITKVLSEIESKLIDINEKSKLRKKVYNVLVEALQNLYHHIDKPPFIAGEELEDDFAIFIFSKGDNSYKISTANFTKSYKYQLLKDRLDQINFLKKDELKSLYKLVLSNEEFSEKGGGGLGMIDIARRTGNKLEYEFIPIEDGYYFFCLEVLIN